MLSLMAGLSIHCQSVNEETDISPSNVFIVKNCVFISVHTYTMCTLELRLVFGSLRTYSEVRGDVSVFSFLCADV